jgi:L-fuconolactonase
MPDSAVPGTAIAYGHATVDQTWLDQVQETVLEPELPIVDPHHHLWHDRPAGRFMLEDLAADLATGHDIRATAYMQCGWAYRQNGPAALRAIGETEAVAAVATLSETGAYGPARACAGIIGCADLRADALDVVLDAHEEAGGGRFRGIRHICTWDAGIAPTTLLRQEPGLLLDPNFRRGIRRLGERGLIFDAWQYHTQLDDLLGAVREVPGTTVVINHVGGPLGVGAYRADRAGVMQVWTAAMRALAACPNTVVKLGGLGMPVNGFDYHKLPSPPDSGRIAADWRPFIEPCIEWFGPARCMFESNFPVDKGMVGYRVLWNAFKRLAAGASAGEKAALFHDTASRIYRLDGPA